MPVVPRPRPAGNGLVTRGAHVPTVAHVAQRAALRPALPAPARRPLGPSRTTAATSPSSPRIRDTAGCRGQPNPEAVARTHRQRR
ncbi:hypothetical protein SSBG_02828 [Streptomyces sp. SPB074]|nr:hypothetical protein SSBG_02828 [Streptomyces sp. SPB074]